MSKLLIVDDAPDLLEILKIFFESKDFTVKTLTRAANIITEIERFKPDLVLLDIYLCGEDGRDICKKIKSYPETKDITILVFSASSKILEDYEKYHADDFIEKPFDLIVLEQKIRSLLLQTTA